MLRCTAVTIFFLLVLNLRYSQQKSDKNFENVVEKPLALLSLLKGKLLDHNTKYHLNFDAYKNCPYPYPPDNDTSSSDEEGNSNESDKENAKSEKDRIYEPFGDHMTLSPEQRGQDPIDLENGTLVSQDFEIVGVKVYPYHLKEFLEEQAKIIPIRGWAKLIDWRNVQGVMQSRHCLIELFKHMVSQYVFEHCCPIERLVWGTIRPIQNNRPPSPSAFRGFYTD